MNNNNNNNNNVQKNAIIFPNLQTATRRFNSFRNDLAFDKLKRPKYKRTNFILIASLVCQFIALLLTTIVYIFPIWVSINIQEKITSSQINVTETKNSIQLTVLNTNQIQFNLGIWEIKTNQYSILTNVLTGSSVSSSNTMLWLDATYSNSAQSFVFYFLSFIELSSTNIFVIQVLEVLHLIFIFLSFTTTSLVLCLCSQRLISPCWYLISFILTTIGFITGLSVIILIVIWQASAVNPIFNIPIQFVKNFAWCFYVSIVTNCCLFLACLLILVFMIVDSMLLYEERKKTLNNLKLEMQRDIVRSIPIDYSNMPRLQKNLLINQINNELKTLDPFDLITGVYLRPFYDENPSYLLNFGNGNYYKRNVQMNDDDIDENYFQKNDNYSNKIKE